MKVFFLIICTSLLFFSCQKKEIIEPDPKNEKQYITDPLVYEVINAVLKMPEIKKDSAKYMLNTSNLFLFSLEIDGENFYGYAEEHFGEVDKFEIENQIKLSRSSYYKKGKINNIKLIDYDLTNVKTHKQLDSLKESTKEYIPYISISFPIFNKQKNVAFLSYHYDCGFLCAHGKKFFIKKVNGKWEIVLVYEQYIS